MLNKLAKNSFYRKNFHFFVLFFVLFLSLLSAFTLAGFTHKRQRAKEIAQYIDQSVTNLNETFEDDLHNFMEVNLHHYLKPSTFGQFFTNTDSDSDFFTKIRMSAIDSMRLQQNLKSLILYRTSDSALLSTLSVRSDFTDNNPAYAYVTAAIKSENAHTPGFVRNTDGDVLYYYPFHGRSSSNDLLGCVMVQLRSPEEFFQIHVEQLNPKGTFLILSNGHILSVEGYNTLSNEIIETILQEAPPLSRIFTYDNADIARYHFYCTPAVSGIQYVYYEPANAGFSLFKQLFTEEWGFPLLLMCVTTILFFLIAARYTSKLQEQHTHTTSELSATTVLLPNQELSAAELFPNANVTCFSSILIEYHVTSDLQDISKLQALICSSCEQHLSGCQIAYKIIPQPMYILCYVGYSEYNMRVLCDSLKQILYNTVDNCEFVFYHTNTLNSVSEMQEETHYLQRSLHYTQILGYGSRFSIRLIRSCNESTDVVATDITATIRKLLNEKHYNEAIEFLETNKTNIYRSFRSLDSAVHYSHHAIYHFMESSFFAIKGFFLEKSYSNLLTRQTMLNALQSHTGVEHFCDYLIQNIREYQEANEQNVSAHEKNFMDAVYQYIEQNLSSVTLNSMAEHFHITSAHLSRMFKKNTDQNFSEYLSEKKLQKAIQLLEQDDKMSINEISHELGYSTPAYFLTKFKERYGITPSAYRKSYLTKSTQEQETSDL